MFSVRGLIAAGMLACADTTLAQLNFDTDATLHDYPSLADGHGHNNPPWCEIDYSSVDLNSVTAYCAIDKSTCGACLQVCGSVGCKYMLAIDQCSRSDGLLDLSTGAGMEICGSDTGHHQVKATQVEAAKCEHIWNGHMYFSYATPYGGLATLASLLGGATATSNPVAVTKTPESEPVSVYSAPVASIPASMPIPVPSYVSSEISSVSVAESFTLVSTNQPWTVPTSTAYSVIPPFSNSTSVASAPVAVPTNNSNADTPSVSAFGGAFGETNTACNGASTTTVTIPGSTVYVTVTATRGNGAGASNPGIQYTPSSTDGVLAETAAGDSTSSKTTTIRSTSTVWTTRTTTITGCPSGVTNCPASLQTPSLSIQTTAIETTVIPSAGPSLTYPGVSGIWNGTQASSTHRPIDIPNAAAASAGAYVAQVKARDAIAAPMPHAKRSAASTSTGPKNWETVLALSGLTAVFFIAF